MIEAVHTTALASSKAAGRLYFYLLRYQYLFLSLVLAAVLFDLMAVARRSPLGTDDLMARISAQSSSLWTMLMLLREQPVNVDAPVFPVLAYCAARLPLRIDVAIQVPSMIAMCVALIAIFLFIRDRLGIGAAYVAVGFLSTNAYTLYGAKARPYALLLAGVALTILCWQRAIAKARNRRPWLIALSVSTVFALLSHYFAAVSILAIVLAEFTRCLLRRKVDWSIWAALGLPALLFIPFYLTFAPAGQPYRPHPFDHLNLPDLLTTYKYTLSFRSVTITLVTAILLAIALGRPKRSQSLPVHDWIAAASLIVGPVLLFVAGMLYTHTYATRYGICAVLGVAIVLTAVTSHIAGGNVRILIPAFVLAFAFYQLHFISLARQDSYSSSSSWANATPELLQKYPGLPLVTPDFDYWMRIKFYAPSWLSSPLIMVTNPESMLKFKGSENPALAALAIHRWTGWPLADYHDFVRQHRQFLMYGEYWMWDALAAEGAKIQLLDYIGPYRLYLVSLPIA